jgi:methylenetetrahydrofolate dehydrogenase (NADP+)/methenyltetrahydrofolate cyclohydrolase
VTERATIIDGERAADELIAEISLKVAAFTRRTHVAPGLALVAIDDDPVQRLYVRKKVVQCERAGIRPVAEPLTGAATTDVVIDVIARLNADPSVHGIFVQWPLPVRVDLAAVSAAIVPAKDIDGMASSEFAPAGALASFRLLELATPALAGRIAVIASDSMVFAKPIARMLLDAKCSVTLATRNNNELATTCRRADILIAALGEPERIRSDWIKPGATVIDASVNAVAGRDGKPRYVGDVRFDEAVRVAGAITPVPGGVGPMTIACLLENTLAAAKRILKIED